MPTTVARIRLKRHGGGDRCTVRITAGAETFDQHTTVTTPIADKLGFRWNVRIVKVENPKLLLLELTPVIPEAKDKRGPDSGDITLVTQLPGTSTPVTVDYVND